MLTWDNGFQNTGRDLHELFTIPEGNTLILHALLHCIFRRDWEVMSKTRALCFIKGSEHLKTIKALGLRPRAFICFLVFGFPDETFALVFDILRQRVTLCYSELLFATLEFMTYNWFNFGCGI